MTRPRRSNTWVRAVAPLISIFPSTTTQREGDGCSQVDYPTGVAIAPGWGVRGPNDMKGRRSMGFKSRGVLAVLVAILAMSAIVATAAWASGSPFVETKPARSVSKTEALLNGVVDPNGAETKYHFEYGTTTSYGKSTAEVSIGSGTSNLEESKAITGLTASTTYHFRIVAKNSNGTSDGADQAFTTRSEESGCHIKAGSKKFGLCVEGASTASAPIQLESLEEPTVIGLFEESEKESGTSLRCNPPNTVGEFTGSESLTLKEKVTFTSCSLAGPLKEQCAVPSTNAFNETQGVFGGNPDNFAVHAVVGEPLLELPFTQKNGCPSNFLFGAHHLEGQYECTISAPEAEAVKHQEICEGKKLKYHEMGASIRYYAFLSLTGSDKGKKFSIYEH